MGEERFVKRLLCFARSAQRGGGGGEFLTYPVAKCHDAASRRNSDECTGNKALHAGLFGRRRERDLSILVMGSNSRDDDVDTLECLDELVFGPAEIGGGDFDASLFQSCVGGFVHRGRTGQGDDGLLDVLDMRGF